MKKGKYTVLIICEGQKTEPNFFESIIDDNSDSSIRYTIFPEPQAEENENKNIKVPHKKKRRIRTTKLPSHQEVNIEVVSAPLPLNWVKTGKKELQDGTYKEVWVVFDHDDFPARKEAFEEAEESVNGNYVNIAFSSRSFEYYFLSHFERIYKQFEQTDCKFKKDGKKNKTFVRCGTNKYTELDCGGDKCINGYAQSKNYWENTDKDNSKKSRGFYNKIKSKFEIGFENSSWLRLQSTIHEGEKQIYDRNPIIHNTDVLVKRILNSEIEHLWIQLNSICNIGKIEILALQNEFRIKNIYQNSIIIPQNSLEIHNGTQINYLGNRNVLAPDKYVNIELNISSYDNSWYKFTFENKIIMFEG